MVYDWHRDVLEKSQDAIKSASVANYKRIPCAECGRYRCLHQALKAQRPSTAATKASAVHNSQAKS